MKRSIMFAIILSSLVASTPPLAQTPTTAPPWTLTDAQIREIVGRVRAGRDLTPKSWPNGGGVAVGFSFDLDNETGTLRMAARVRRSFRGESMDRVPGCPVYWRCSRNRGLPPLFSCQP